MLYDSRKELKMSVPHSMDKTFPKNKIGVCISEKKDNKGSIGVSIPRFIVGRFVMAGSAPIPECKNLARENTVDLINHIGNMIKHLEKHRTRLEGELDKLKDGNNVN